MVRCFVIIITAIMLSYITGCTEKEKSAPDVQPPQMKTEDIHPQPEPIVVTQEPNEPNDAEPVGPNVATEPNTADFHNFCAGIFKNYVNEKGLVNYASLRRKGITILRNVVRQFATVDPNEYKSLPRADKIAFWINAYNVNKLAAVVENYPIESTTINRWWWGAKSFQHIWPKVKIYKFLVMDEEFSFATVENDILGKEFDDPRILFALTQLTLSSPVLYNQPYYGKNLDAVLDEHIKSFLAGPYGLKIGREASVVYLPSVLHPRFSNYGRRFITKFGTDKKFKDKSEDVRAVLNFVSKYVSEKQKDFLERKNYTVKYNKYDWTLNDSSR